MCCLFAAESVPVSFTSWPVCPRLSQASALICLANRKRNHISCWRRILLPALITEGISGRPVSSAGPRRSPLLTANECHLGTASCEQQDHLGDVRLGFRRNATLPRRTPREQHACFLFVAPARRTPSPCSHETIKSSRARCLHIE